MTISKKNFLWIIFLSIIPVYGSANTNLFLKQKIPGFTKNQEESEDIYYRDNEKKSKIELVVPDSYNRGTPRSSMAGYLNSSRKENYKQAINYIDFDGVNKEIRKIPREEVAKIFKLVLDRSLWIDLAMLSDEPTGFENDGIPGNRDLAGYIPLNENKVPVYVQRMPREDGVLIWKIAGITINYLPELYQQYGDGAVGRILTEFIPHKSILGLQLWQWITLILIIIIAFTLAWIPTRLIAPLVLRRGTVMAEQIAAIITRPVRVLLFILIARALCPLLSLSLESRKITQGYTLLIIAFTWTILSIINILRDYFIEKLTKDDKKSIAKLLNPITTMIKILVVLTASLVWLENLGFKASTILAGLGIGGLAFALAAQKSIENIIAAITMYITSPVKVGNLCKIGKYLGFIEEIGLRYTKVRTLDRTVVNISNAIFADLELENYSERNRIRYKPDLVLSYRSSKEQVEGVITDIKKMLDDHEKVCASPCRVRLANYLEHGISISVVGYVDTTRFAVYAEVSNELNLAIIDILDKHKVKLADLSRTGWAKTKQEAVDTL